MVDPLRKKSLGRHPTQSIGRTTVQSMLVKSDSFVVRSHHTTKAGHIDLNSLAKGSSAEGKRCGPKGRPFRGRPLLIKAFIEPMRENYALSTASTLNNVKHALRNFWWFMDSLDETPLRVDSLSDIHELHSTLWLRSGPVRSHYVIVSLVVRLANKKAGLPPQFWPSAPDQSVHSSDGPSQQSIKLLYRQLKDRIRCTLQRWSEADRLALEGSSRLGAPQRKWTPEDLHATVRAAIAKLGKPLLTPSEFNKARGKTSRTHIPTCTGGSLWELLAGIYPTKTDVQDFLHLVILKTGWNPQVALDIDISKEWSFAHPTSPDIVILHSVKTRGGKPQQAISLKRHTFSPFKLIEILLERSKSLRSLCVTELQSAKSAADANPKDAALAAEVVFWESAVRSPWIHIAGKKFDKVAVLNQGSYSKTVLAGRGHVSYMSVLISEINEAAKSQISSDADMARLTIPQHISTTDLRDAFIDHVYAASGYNWLVAKVAAGHTTISALRHYLRRNRYRRHSEDQARKLQAALFSEIEQKQLLDPVVLRALVDRGEITELQRANWEAHKSLTRMGMGCVDPYNPPANIDPEHEDGVTCRIQRCILCRHGIVLQVSLEGLTRRKAELLHIQELTPISSWIEGDLGDELERLDATLGQFDAAEVEDRVAFWEQKIAMGEHRPLDFEGTYELAS